jgi:hypothetical protein
MRRLKHLSVYVVVLLAGFLAWGFVGKDHFAAIPLNGDRTWYLNNLDGVPNAIQDRDIFYHNIGHSIDNARQADIIILGHSMFTVGLRYDLVREFAIRHHVKIFNMTVEGVPEGEFSRQVIVRWGLMPKLWIINADDRVHDFFDSTITDYGNFHESAADNVVTYGRLTGYYHVIYRNLLWRAMLLASKIWPWTIRSGWSNDSPETRLVANVWRSAQDGNADIDEIPVFARSGNPPMFIKRNQNCPASPEEIEHARSYLAAIGGTAVLSLAPAEGFCPQRVRELGAALNVETIIPPDVRVYTSWDDVHLDKAGAVAFTQFFLMALEHTTAFEQIADHR